MTDVCALVLRGAVNMHTYIFLSKKFSWLFYVQVHIHLYLRAKYDIGTLLEAGSLILEQQ